MPKVKSLREINCTFIFIFIFILVFIGLCVNFLGFSIFPSLSPLSCQSGYTSEIVQRNITWTFDGCYRVGQFVNGDWWVVGPVTITSVSPGWDGVKDGSMLDPDLPDQLNYQGYDTRATYTFDDNIRVKFPVTISGVKSLISSIGLDVPMVGGAYDTLDQAEVLTIVNNPVAAGTFRPQYLAGNKIFWNINQLDYSKVPSLPVPDGVGIPNLDGVMTRVWLAHGPKTWGAAIHPRSNMPPYPRDSSYQVSDIAVAAVLNTSSQHDYINRLVQLGIDLYPISLVNGNAFQANGGFGSGWKFPIVFAGVVLNDNNMKNPPMYSFSTIEKFGEDGYTYYGQPTAGYPNGKPLFGEDCATEGFGFFAHHNCRDPAGIVDSDQLPNAGGYGLCCTSATWVGQALTTRLMNAESTWNHSAYFDYVDRWVSEGRGSDGFVSGVWSTYRQTGSIGCPVPQLSDYNSASLAGSSFSYDLFATTIIPSNNAISYSASGLPAGLSISGNRISGTPTTAGVYTIGLTSSSICGSDSGTLNIVVAPNSLSSLPNPVLYYSFDSSNISGNTIIDQSNFANNGNLINGLVIVSGYINQAVSFSGSNYVNAGSSSSLDDLPTNGGMTISMWIKPNAVTNSILLAKDCDLGESAGCWAFKLSNGNLNFIHHGIFSSLNVLSSQSISLGQWQHIALTSDGNSGNTHIYINGIESSLTSASGGPPFDSDSSYNLLIGTNANHNKNYNGLIDDLTIYNQILPAQNIYALSQIKNITNPRVNLVSPINNAVVSSPNINFAAAFTDDSGLSNVTFFLWNSTVLLNRTAISLKGTSNSTSLNVNLPH